MRTTERGRRSGAWCAVLGRITATLLLAACATDAPEATAPGVGDAILAKGGPGGGGSTSVSVTSTAPAYGRRGTTLDVRVYGSGFASDAVAVVERRTDHQLRQLFPGHAFNALPFGRDLALAQHGNAVGHGRHLVQFMADKNK